MRQFAVTLALLLFLEAFAVAAAARPAPSAIPAAGPASGTDRPSGNLSTRTPPPEPELTSPPTDRIGTVLVSGKATWYCNADATRGRVSRCVAGHPDGPGRDLFAAVRPNLRWLRGSVVRVTAGGRHVVVRVIDCNCGADPGPIDLYADAFELLAPLGAGAIRVSIEGPFRIPRPPATDTAP